MGKSAERNIGLLVLRIPYIKDLLFRAIESYKCLQEKWHPERMKLAIEAVTNKAITQYKVLTFVSLPQTAGKMKVTAVRAMKAQSNIVLNTDREAQVKQ
jgi:hypothetical protein